GPTTYLSDTWKWDGTNWSSASALASPTPRAYHTLAYDESRDRVVLFGGAGSGSVWLTDTWEWDGVTWSNVGPPTGPQPTQAGAMAYDRQRQLTVLVPGSNLAFDAGSNQDAGVDAGSGFHCNYVTCFQCNNTPGSEDITLTFVPDGPIVTDREKYITSNSYALSTLFNSPSGTNYFSRDTTASTF